MPSELQEDLEHASAEPFPDEWERQWATQETVLARDLQALGEALDALSDEDDGEQVTAEAPPPADNGSVAPPPDEPGLQRVDSLDSSHQSGGLEARCFQRQSDDVEEADEAVDASALEEYPEEYLGEPEPFGGGQHLHSSVAPPFALPPSPSSLHSAVVAPTPGTPPHRSPAMRPVLAPLSPLSSPGLQSLQPVMQPAGLQYPPSTSAVSSPSGSFLTSPGGTPGASQSGRGGMLLFGSGGHGSFGSPCSLHAKLPPLGELGATSSASTSRSTAGSVLNKSSSAPALSTPACRSSKGKSRRHASSDSAAPPRSSKGGEAGGSGKDVRRARHRSFSSEESAAQVQAAAPSEPHHGQLLPASRGHLSSLSGRLAEVNDNSSSISALPVSSPSAPTPSEPHVAVDGQTHTAHALLSSCKDDMEDTTLMSIEESMVSTGFEGSSAWAEFNEAVESFQTESASFSTTP
eukprot:TRINITY_DN4985_c0_g1_i1.p1 TRINITY_DN4985_c0_g1~~TRINITY_DN4985_c0_g1_i1.p1  ORF type:complete len:463 (+),score=86.57 TRINITY_DN4985_c0_g1_i1:946-2334(+)